MRFSADTVNGMAAFFRFRYADITLLITYMPCRLMALYGARRTAEDISLPLRFSCHTATFFFHMPCLFAIFASAHYHDR